VNHSAVIGGGAWGTALAGLLAHGQEPVKIWAYEADVVADINRHHENRRYLPGVVLPHAVMASGSISEVLAGATALLFAVPSHVAETVAVNMRPYLPSVPIVSATKGLDDKGLRPIAELLEETLNRSRGSILALSGPSFAAEVGRGLPTAVVLAGEAGPAAALQRRLMTPTFRVYVAGDRLGVELGGALKNVIALAAGISDGLGFGHNTRAALITRGLAEMVRLGSAMGADARTFAGLSGMGDLVLTCTGALSRNRAVGLQLADGNKLVDILGGTHTVAEGVNTARIALKLAERHRIEMPIVAAVCEILFNGKEPRQAVFDLMDRAARHELD
jgi:glycerol-3-phosphate dehydrogenase (NAD(P)+)